MNFEEHATYVCFKKRLGRKLTNEELDIVNCSTLIDIPVNTIIDEKNKYFEKYNFVKVKEPGHDKFDGIGIIAGVNSNNDTYYVFYKRKKRRIVDEVLTKKDFTFFTSKAKKILKNESVKIFLKELYECWKTHNIIPISFTNIITPLPSWCNDSLLPIIDIPVQFMGAYLMSPKICDDIIKYFQNNTEKIHKGFVLGKYGEPNSNKIIKDSLDILFFTPNKEPCQECKNYAHQLDLALHEYKKKYKGCNNLRKFKINEGFQIQYYEPGMGFHAHHCERPGDSRSIYRHLVFMTYLNDVTDRGETEFFYQDAKFKPKKGLTLIWPADWTFTHRGIASPTQQKYIVTGWIAFDRQQGP